MKWIVRQSEAPTNEYWVEFEIEAAEPESGDPALPNLSLGTIQVRKPYADEAKRRLEGRGGSPMLSRLAVYAFLACLLWGLVRP